MIFVKNFYIKNYVFESNLYDEMRMYIEEHKHTWRHHRIEINYDGADLRSAHVISHMLGTGSVIKEKKQTGLPPNSNTGVEKPGKGN